MNKVYLTEKKVCELLSLSRTTLNKYRKTDFIPRNCWFKIGRNIRYNEEILLKHFNLI